DAEMRSKKLLVQEVFDQAKVAVPDFDLTGPEDSAAYGYRNKMEYSFWGDDSGLHLALHYRGSHGKQAVEGCVLARPGIDQAAQAVCAHLAGLQVRAGNLKTIIVRCSQNGDVVASLFVKPESFPQLPLMDGLKGLRVYHSNPKSPASVRTRLLNE